MIGTQIRLLSTCFLVSESIAIMSAVTTNAVPGVHCMGSADASLDSDSFLRHSGILAKTKDQAAK